MSESTGSGIEADTSTHPNYEAAQGPSSISSVTTEIRAETGTNALVLSNPTDGTMTVNVTNTSGVVRTTSVAAATTTNVAGLAPGNYALAARSDAQQSVRVNGNSTATVAIPGSPAGGNGSFDVAFLDCQTARISGTFTETKLYYRYVGQMRSAPGSVSATDIPGVTEPPYEGTFIYRTGDEAESWVRDDGTPVIQVASPVNWSTALSSITVNETSKENPYEADCLNRDAFRPDRPTASVDDATRIDDETIAVAFSYRNPNDDVLYVDSGFAGATVDTPPGATGAHLTRLDPGSNTFTVEWTPRQDDERLVWTVNLSRYGLSDPVTVRTRPAAAYEERGETTGTGTAVPPSETAAETRSPTSETDVG